MKTITPTKRICTRECLVFPNCDCSLAWAWLAKNKAWPEFPPIKPANIK